MLARSNITEVPNKVFDRLYPHQGARGGHSKRADERSSSSTQRPPARRHRHQVLLRRLRQLSTTTSTFPSFARRTLDELAARRDPFAMPTEQLNVLAAIRGPGIGRFP